MRSLASVLAFRVLPVGVAAAALAATLAITGQPNASAAGTSRLPDLDQDAPTHLVVTRAGRVHRLGFASGVRNVGDGPLIIDGHRTGADVESMVADQVIVHDGEPQEVVPGVGELRYVVSPDHRHWHLLGFERYYLRRAGHRTATVRDRKSGFCLGDRFRVTDRSLPSAPPEPVYTSRCGLDDPGLLGIREGISVGYGDDYIANLEGQYLPLNGLRGGRYVLVHRVNEDRRLRELRYGNNAASLLLELRWRRGRPQVRVLKECPGTGRCDWRAPPRE
jgi:Lysyl oxidase